MSPTGPTAILALSPVLLGGLAGLIGALGVLAIASALRRRRPTLLVRLDPYVHQRAAGSGLLSGADAEGASMTDMLLAMVTGLGSVLESMGSSAASVRSRLARSGSPLTLEQFRLQQLAWAAAGFLASVCLGALAALAGSTRLPAFLLVALLASACGAAARDWRLSHAVKARRARIEAQLPDVVELLALAVGAGQGPVAAMERVVGLGSGDLVAELSTTLTDIRSGTVLTSALDHLEARVGSLHVTRLCEAISVALERGTPLAEVLRSQAADVREAARRDLMEAGGRREIAQMVPVVFLVLPITVVFALFPGLFVLRLGL